MPKSSPLTLKICRYAAVASNPTRSSSILMSVILSSRQPANSPSVAARSSQHWKPIR